MVKGFQRFQVRISSLCWNVRDFQTFCSPFWSILSVSESGRDETTFVFNGDFVAATSELAAKKALNAGLR